MSSPKATAVVEAIRLQNAGRDPERLAIKIAKMKGSPFIFLRGAAHLFYDTLPDHPLLNEAPLAWCCGDLHFENFGSYKADNRLAYFDINDFDEAALAPCTWDIVRLLTSIRCGADVLRTSPDEAILLARDCLAAYRAALVQGKAMWVERETTKGLIHDLLAGLQDRDRAEFLDGRTIKKGNLRQLKVDGVKALSATRDEREKVTTFLKGFAAEQESPGFYRVLDVARRIAGTGSLGVTRFVILIEGKGSPDGNYLLDLKETRPSALLPTLKRRHLAQPKWANEAQRVVAIQKRMQAVVHAFLVPVDYADTSCILRGLQPSEDRVAIADWGKKLSRLQEVVSVMGRLAAWDQLRSSGRDGAPCADQLIDFAASEDWLEAMLELVDAMVKTTVAQWDDFRANYP